MNCVHIQGYTEQVCIFWVLDDFLSLAKLKKEIPWTRCCKGKKGLLVDSGFFREDHFALIMEKSPMAASNSEKKPLRVSNSLGPGL